MLEYLEKLAEDQEWEKAIEYAEHLLLNPENNSWDLMVIYTRLCQARFETDEFYGAQVAGELAMKMTRELEAWDYFGTAALWLGVAYARLRQPEPSLAVFYDYLGYVTHYRAARQFYPLVLTNIGFLHAQSGDFVEAISVLQKAANLATEFQDHRNAHSIRLRLIKAYFDSGKLDQIPPLLVKCGHYLRHNPEVPYYNRNLLNYIYYRVQYATATHRFKRATMVAKRALRLAQLPEAVEPAHDIRHLLAQLYERQGELSSALSEAVRARTLALEARRFDLEYTITDYLYGLLRAHPNLVQQAENDQYKKEG